MPRNTAVSLGGHFTSFIDAQVKTGRYGSASEVVRAGLRLLQEHEAKVKALEAALIEGEESGEATRNMPGSMVAEGGGRPLPLAEGELDNRLRAQVDNNR